VKSFAFNGVGGELAANQETIQLVDAGAYVDAQVKTFGLHPGEALLDLANARERGSFDPQDQSREQDQEQSHACEAQANSQTEGGSWQTTAGSDRSTHAPQSSESLGKKREFPEDFSLTTAGTAFAKEIRLTGKCETPIPGTFSRPGMFMKSKVQARIVIAKADTSVADSLKRVLEGAGYEVTFASPGPTDKGCPSTWEPDLVVLDLDGIFAEEHALMDWLRETPRVPLLLLSAAATHRDMEEAQCLGALLEKPSDADYLLTIVAELLKPPAAHRARMCSRSNAVAIMERIRARARKAGAMSLPYGRISTFGVDASTQAIPRVQKESPYER
jgi:CheY-like chemotaxis protein